MNSYDLNRFRIFARLGEYDLETTDEVPHQDVVIARSVPHKEFDPEMKLNDIAIIYLSRDVKFTGEYRKHISLVF